eukprot:1236373-Karenia_brevis.AAC.1
MKRGVKQGRASSMRIFCDVVSHFLAPVVRSWEAKGFGILVGSRRWTHLGFADDFTILARSREMLREM